MQIFQPFNMSLSFLVSYKQISPHRGFSTIGVHFFKYSPFVHQHSQSNPCHCRRGIDTVSPCKHKIYDQFGHGHNSFSTYIHCRIPRLRRPHPPPPPHLHDSIGQKLGRGLICEIVTFLPNKCHMGVRSLHFSGYLMGKHDKVRHIQCIPQMASFIAVHM